MDVSVPKKVSIQSHHIEKLKQINQKLLNIKNEESSLIKIDLIFFDSLTMLREYDAENEISNLLAQLKAIHQNEYLAAHAYRRSMKSKAVVIRKYYNDLYDGNRLFCTTAADSY